MQQRAFLLKGLTPKEFRGQAFSSWPVQIALSESSNAIQGFGSNFSIDCPTPTISLISVYIATPNKHGLVFMHIGENKVVIERFLERIWRNLTITAGAVG